MTPTIHRREATIAAALPHNAPVSRLLWTIHEGEEDWVVLAFADVEHGSRFRLWLFDV